VILLEPHGFIQPGMGWRDGEQTEPGGTDGGHYRDSQSDAQPDEQPAQFLEHVT
jgi:hypothetical protein